MDAIFGKDEADSLENLAVEVDKSESSA